MKQELKIQLHAFLRDRMTGEHLRSHQCLARAPKWKAMLRGNSRACDLELGKLVFKFWFNGSLAVTLAKLLHLSHPPFLSCKLVKIKPNVQECCEDVVTWLHTAPSAAPRQKEKGTGWKGYLVSTGNFHHLTVLKSHLVQPPNLV